MPEPLSSSYTLPRSASRGAIPLLLALTVAACASGYDSQVNRLGVLPPPEPAPLWLGVLRSAGDPALNGAIAATPSATPHWTHLLLSIKGGVPGAAYTWRLQSGTCGNAGGQIGPADRFVTIVPGADGTAATETTIPGTLSPDGSYAVTVSGGTNAANTACGELAYRPTPPPWSSVTLASR